MRVLNPFYLNSSDLNNQNNVYNIIVCPLEIVSVKWDCTLVEFNLLRL